MEKTYSIAGLKVRVTGQQTARNIASLPGFSVFEYTDPRDADIIINTDRHILTGLPSGIRLLNSYRVMEIDHYFWSFDGGYLFEMKRDGAHVVTMLHKSHTNEVSMSSCNCEISLKFATWVAYSFVAVKMGVIPVHSSAIVNNSHAVLFLGESGTGKSTHTRLWIKYIENSYLLNDDCPLVRAEDNRVLAYGSPWSGKVHCYRQEALPLKAIVRLRQGPENKIGKLGRLNSIGAIYPSCPPLFAYDNLLSGKMLETISRLVPITPAYTLECRPDRLAAETAYNTIY